MENTGKTAIKKWIKEEFAPLAKQHGFRVGTFFGTGTFAIYRSNDNEYHSIWFDIDSNSVGYGVIVRMNAVEELLYRYSQKGVFKSGDTIDLSTTHEKFSYTPRTTKEELAAYLLPLKERFAEVVEQMEYYSTPQHVLDLWMSLDTLDERNRYFWGPYKYIKMMVVAQLCGSPLYDTLCQNALAMYKKYIEEGEDYSAIMAVCENVIEHYKQQ